MKKENKDQNEEMLGNSKEQTQENDRTDTIH